MYYWDSVGEFFYAAETERKREECRQGCRQGCREEYSKLLKYLNKKIPKEEELYNKLKTGCDMVFKIMKGIEKKEILVGEFVKMYDNKFSICQMDNTNLLALERGVAKW